MVLTNTTCPAANTVSVDQATFFDGNWDAHEIGWVIAGSTALVSTAISFVTVFQHARNYYVPKQQRQIIRILLMPPVYGIVSFFSYRFFRAYTYYSVALVAYESLVLAAFLMLLLQYVGSSTAEHKKVLMQKEKSKIPIPFCCIRYRPSKPYFLHALKWSVLQYSLLRPLISIAGIITEAYGVLCPTQYSIYYAEIYLEAVDFVSISVALYGLIVLYALLKENLAGRKPLAKFLAIKGIVMLTFYQGFVFSTLESHHVIKGTEYWTASNVAEGLQALCTCCEMVLFSAWFHNAFTSKPYRALRPAGTKGTNPFWALLDSLNYWDFLVEGWNGIVFTCQFIMRKPGTHASSALSIEDALATKSHRDPQTSSDQSDLPMQAYQQQPAMSTLPSTVYRRPSQEKLGEKLGQQPAQEGHSTYQMEETVDEYERRTAWEDQQQALQQQNYGYQR